MLSLGDYSAALAPTLLIVGLALAVLPLLDKRSAVVRVLLLGLTVVMAWRYMAWRVSETIPPPGFDLDALFGWVFVLLEAGTHAFHIRLALDALLDAGLHYPLAHARPYGGGGSSNRLVAACPSTDGRCFDRNLQ